MADVQLTALDPPPKGVAWVLKLSGGHAALHNQLGEEVEHIPSSAVPGRISFPNPLLSRASLVVVMPHDLVKSMQFQADPAELQVVRAYVDQCLIQNPDRAREMEVDARRGASWNFCWACIGFLLGIGGAVFAFTMLPYDKWAYYSAWIFFLIGGVACLIHGMQKRSEARHIRSLLEQEDREPPAPMR